jgi:hypothetical protein
MLAAILKILKTKTTTLSDDLLFFQNGCRCHGNGQNAKKLKNTKIIIAGYLPNRN